MRLRISNQGATQVHDELALSGLNALQPPSSAATVNRTSAPFLLSGSALPSEPDSQDAASWPSLLRRAAQDQKEIYTAPFHRRNVKWDLLFVAVTGGLIAGDRHISRALSHDHIDISQHISSTRFNKRSDKTAEGASGSVVAGRPLRRHTQQFRERSVREKKRLAQRSCEARL
jgi:hypothetical protein